MGDADPGSDLVVGTGPRAVRIPAGDLHWRFSHASGPGGQGVNTSDSRVHLSFALTTSASLTDAQRARLVAALGPRLSDGRLDIVVAESRSQWRNRSIALKRLAALLAGGLAPPAPGRRATRPSAGARARRREAKAVRTTVKQLRRPPSASTE